MRLRTLAFTFFFSLAVGTTSACSVWDLVKPSNGIEASAEVVVGDKNQALNAEVSGTKNTAEQISIQNIEEVPLSFMILAMLGWLLPSPGAIWRGLLQLLPWAKKE